MPIRIRHFSIALPLALALALTLALQTAPGAAAEAGPRALVVLVGEAGQGDALTLVLSELLVRQGVTPEFERRERFRSSALLSENPRDARVWVFVTESGPRVAKLYFRGPRGQRFLLRTLSLRRGLDELGRELIAQVVETSTVALLRSEAGLSREEARAGLSDPGDPAALDGDDGSGPAPGAAAEARASADAAATARARDEHARHLDFDLSARGVARFGGPDLGLDHGVGIETALGGHSAGGLLGRGRLALEYGLRQAIDASAVSATVRTTALRAGVDVGSAFGTSALVVGAGAGVDLTRISPDGTTDSSLALAGKSTGAVPVVRIEARYELSLGAFRVTGGLLGDVSLVDTHYDLQSGPGGASQRRLATPWIFRPGMALTLGWCPAW